ncbi:MATE family efflux transporter [Ruminococcus sp. HUN007]|uniref:MATE family efflux transporter n=1 Tax=Ruminococcus sp. HUN007 TaxID=1514668 RepID=UPI0005D168C8|nr:MATE family efflux transporter [Ruminococcus sp. HUN007]
MNNKSETASLNMTEGGILKNLLIFAAPILIGNIFQQLYNVTDTAIIGNILGDNALAAAGASAPVYGLLISFSHGMSNGFSVVIARYFGAQNEREMKKSVALTYLLSAVIALILTVTFVLLLHPLMQILKTPADIISDTENYLRIILLFSTVTIAYNTLAAMLRAVGNSRAPLYFLVISTLVNIALDFLFVKGFGMGIAGAAWATVISQVISVILCFIYTLKKCRFLIFRKSELVYDTTLLGDLISTGMAMALMHGVVQVGSVILQSGVNSFGTATVTAHTAGRKIDEIFMLPLGTISMSAATFTSQNFGADRLDRVKKGIICSIMIAEVWSVIALTGSLLFRIPLVKALSGSTDEFIISTASKYIIINVSFFFILDVLLVLRSSLQGVGRKLVPITGSIMELILKAVTVAVLAPWLGYLGICITEPIIWIVCAILVLIDYSVFLKKYRLAQ